MGTEQLKQIDIAEMANISPKTLDRILHNRPGVAKATEERVRKLLKEINYQPNIFAQSLVRKDSAVIAVVCGENMNVAAGTYLSLLRRGIERAADELKNFKVKVEYFYFEKSSESTLLKVLEEIEKRKISGILYTSILPTGSPLKKLVEIASTIPVVMLTNFGSCPIDNVDYLGRDSSEAGALCGELMAPHIPEGGTVVMLELHEHYRNRFNLRLRKFREYFEEHFPNIKIEMYVLNPEEEINGYVADFDKILERYQNVKGFYFSGPLVHYAAEYLEAKGIKGKITLIGYDLTEQNIAALRRGTIKFIISTKAQEQGYQGIQILFRKGVVKRAEQSINMTMPLEIVTKYNVDSILNYKF